MNTGIQEYRNKGIQEYRNTGIQEYRNTGIQEYIQEYRNTGIQIKSSLVPLPGACINMNVTGVDIGIGCCALV